jgi:hypothetical protein
LIRRRDARSSVDAREVALQGLEQAHEVPNGEDVVLHEHPHFAHALHHRVELVVEDGLSQGLNAALQGENSKFHM